MRDLEIIFYDSEGGSLSEDSWDSDIRPSECQKRNVIESDSEKDFENEWIENDITHMLNDCWNIPGVIDEISDVPNIRDVIDLIFYNEFFYLVIFLNQFISLPNATIS